MDALSALLAGGGILIVAGAVLFSVAVLSLPFVWGIYSRMRALASDVAAIRGHMHTIEGHLDTVEGDVSGISSELDLMHLDLRDFAGIETSDEMRAVILEKLTAYRDLAALRAQRLAGGSDSGTQPSSETHKA